MELIILKVSVYSLKSRFQTLLLPLQNALIAFGITPNQITLFACILCLTYSMLLAWSTWTDILLLLFPLLMFIRMMFNAIDGMIAKETDNTTPLGMVLNEMCDVVSDIALFSAFFLILQTSMVLWWGLVVLSLLTEFVSIIVYKVTHIRSHSGPFGKSDRAVYLGVLSILLVITANSSSWLTAYIIVGILLASSTIFNRFRSLFSLSANV